MDIDISNNIKPNSHELISLYIDAGWGKEEQYVGKDYVYEKAIDNSNIITAYYKNKLVGFIRYLSDFSHDTFIIEFIVDSKYKNNGIGKKMLDLLKLNINNSDIYINSTETSVEFFKHNGFRKSKLICMSY